MPSRIEKASAPAESAPGTATASSERIGPQQHADAKAGGHEPSAAQPGALERGAAAVISQQRAEHERAPAARRTPRRTGPWRSRGAGAREGTSGLPMPGSAAPCRQRRRRGEARQNEQQRPNPDPERGEQAAGDSSAKPPISNGRLPLLSIAPPVARAAMHEETKIFSTAPSNQPDPPVTSTVIAETPRASSTIPRGRQPATEDEHVSPHAGQRARAGGTGRPGSSAGCRTPPSGTRCRSGCESWS